MRSIGSAPTVAVDAPAGGRPITTRVIMAEVLLALLPAAPGRCCRSPWPSSVTLYPPKERGKIQGLTGAVSGVYALTMPALRPKGIQSTVDWPGAGLLGGWTVPLRDEQRA